MIFPGKKARFETDDSSSSGLWWTVLVKYAHTGTEIAKLKIASTSTIQQLSQHITEISNIKGNLLLLFGGSVLVASQTLIDAGLADGSTIDAIVSEFCVAISVPGPLDSDDSNDEVLQAPTVDIWDVLGSNMRQRLHSEDGGSVLLMAISPCNKHLATYDGTSISLWNLSMSRMTKSRSQDLDEMDFEMYRMEWSACGEFVLLVTCMGGLRAWHVRRGLLRFEAQLLAYGDVLESIAFHQCPPNRMRIAVANSPEIELWHLKTSGRFSLHRKTAVSVPSAVMSMSFSPNGDVLAVGSATEDVQMQATATVQLWSCKMKRHQATLQADPGSGSPIALAFNPMSEKIAVLASNGECFIWNSQTSERLHAFTAHVHDDPFPQCSVLFSPNGALLATGSSEDAEGLKLWCTKTWRQFKIIGSGGAVNSVIFWLPT